MSRTTNKLQLANQFRLNQYTIENYESAGLHDPEFAQKATADLGFVVTAGNIQGIREAFNIKSTLARKRDEAPALLIERIEKLERQVQKLIEIVRSIGGDI
jgi:hypothetical protein